MATSSTRDALRAIVADNGTTIIENPGAVEELLTGGSGAQPEEAALLVQAQKLRIPADLVWSSAVPDPALIERLAVRLQERAHMTDAQSLWAIDTWRYALGMGGATNAAPAPGPASNIPIVKINPASPQEAAPASPQEAAPNGYLPPAPPPPGVWPPTLGGAMQYENTSGMKSTVPAEAQSGNFNWGAFILNWIWLLGQGAPLGALAVIALHFVPFGGIASALYLGLNGNTIAWRNRRFESIEQFIAVQKAWTKGAIVYLLSIIGLVFIVAIGSALLYPLTHHASTTSP